MAVEKVYTQWAPWPESLEKLVNSVRYRPGWKFSLETKERDHAESHGNTAGGLTLIITTKGYNSYHIERGENYRVDHYFPVPGATFNEDSWRHWMLECVLKVEQHEACEFFQIVYKGDFVKRDSLHSDELVVRPFAPTHGPGEDPYIIHEYASEEQRRTRFTGEMNA